MLITPDISHLQHIANAAAQINQAAGSMIHVLDETNQVLRLQAKAAVPAALQEAVAEIPTTEESALARVARDAAHVYLVDIVEDPACKRQPGLAKIDGARSLHSLPLCDTDERVVGVLSARYPTAYRPESTDLVVLETYARIAAGIIEIKRVYEDISARDRRLGIRRQSWTPVAVQTANAARMLIPHLGRGANFALVEATDRVLASLINELRAQFRPNAISEPALTEF